MEETESARGEGGRVGQGRVYRVQAHARWEKALLWQPLVKKIGFDDENICRVPKPDLRKLQSSLACCVLDRADSTIVSISRTIHEEPRGPKLFNWHRGPRRRHAEPPKSRLGNSYTYRDESDLAIRLAGGAVCRAAASGARRRRRCRQPSTPSLLPKGSPSYNSTRAARLVDP